MCPIYAAICKEILSCILEICERYKVFRLDRVRKWILLALGEDPFFGHPVLPYHVVVGKRAARWLLGYSTTVTGPMKSVNVMHHVGMRNITL